jgi:hypothetical protein
MATSFSGGKRPEYPERTTDHGYLPSPCMTIKKNIVFQIELFDLWVDITHI